MKINSSFRKFTKDGRGNSGITFTKKIKIKTNHLPLAHEDFCLFRIQHFHIMTLLHSTKRETTGIEKYDKIGKRRLFRRDIIIYLPDLISYQMIVNSVQRLVVIYHD